MYSVCVCEDQMDAVSFTKILRKDDEAPLQGAISAIGVIHLPRSVHALHQNVIMYRHTDCRNGVYLFAYSFSQQIIGSVVAQIYSLMSPSSPVDIEGIDPVSY